MLDQQKITILYCRLSNEDAQEGESNSIANQREYLTRYARDHGYTNLKILVDDGYTGTNFNRPGVQEGFELVKQGLVGCWLVKDLSRVGRDYLTVGQYTDIIFPSYDVRFIAINDGVDSNRGDSEGFAAIRNLFNEWYPRDTSKKVRVSLRQRGTSGKHMGKPPYGYRCDPEDKDHWILDEEAAPVVKLIFDLCTFRIVTKVLVPEAMPSLLTGAAIAVTTILGYSAMAGFVGGGGLGTIAINYGYYRYQTDVMLVTVALLVIIVQVFQEVGMRIAHKVDKRVKS